MVTGKVLGGEPPTSRARPRLLVSARDPDEAREAVAGGADIIDAKDPAAGALGPVSPSVLAAIRQAVPTRTPLSAALGDGPERESLAGLTASFGPDRLGFGKVGLAGCSQPQADRVVSDTVEQLGSNRVVLVAYADWDLVGALRPEKIRALAIRFSVAGLLLDTARKEHGGLLQLWSYERLSAFVAETRASALMVALAGGLTLLDIAGAVAIGADIIGVRGAACVGGRNGRIDRLRVRALVQSIDHVVQSRTQSPSDAIPDGPTTRHGNPSGSTRLK